MKKAVLVIILMLFAAPVMAQTYSWTDDSGTVNFAEDLGKVPKKYRKKARKLGGEEPVPVPAAKEAPKEKPVAPPADSQGQSAARKAEKGAAYGGKDAETWKKDFSNLKADLKAAEDQLVETRKRLDDTSRMSRGEYLSLQYSIRNIEKRVLELRGKLKDLEVAAKKAEVPADLYQ